MAVTIKMAKEHNEEEWSGAKERACLRLDRYIAEKRTKAAEERAEAAEECADAAVERIIVS
jgi:hypothetical protein